MGFIPANAKWYLADIVEEIQVQDDSQNVIHINTVLVRADSPEEAHAKALELGEQCNRAYENSAGNNVTISFRGLRDLYVIHDELEHGAELFYDERFGLTEEQIVALVCEKENLSVFQPWKGPDPASPDYVAKWVVDALLNALKQDLPYTPGKSQEDISDTSPDSPLAEGGEFR
jgi:hypothetical protein